MRRVTNQLRSFFPEPHELWERGGATIEEVKIDNERYANVPFFNNISIDHIDEIGRELIYNKGKLRGQAVRSLVTMTDGIERATTTYLPTKYSLDNTQFTVHMDTPWLTGDKGHNDEIARRVMAQTGLPLVLVGPEEFSGHRDARYVLRNMAAVAMDSGRVSLARAAQDSMYIAADQVDKFNLPNLVVEIGESRGAMMAGAKHPHAESTGVQPVYYDITDPCLADGIASDPRVAMNVLRFPIQEMTHILPVGVDLALKNRLHTQAGTVPLRAKYLAQAILGTGPAVLSGEAGEFPAFLPANTPVHLTNFRSNPVAHHSRWREKYQHTMFAGVNLKGAHLGLAYDSVARHLIMRIERLRDEMMGAGKLEYVDYRRVHLRDDQACIGSNEHMPRIA
ncbi:hypothetical protein H6796_00290 [Candidatus Nomurabacteria bacterium]|nr:hypothetical protein [Candidatus Nomurabacteria bacterium]